MTFDEVERAKALIDTRRGLERMRILAVASGSQTRVTVAGSNDDSCCELALEQTEARAVFDTRIAAIDAELAKLYVYPPPPPAAESVADGASTVTVAKWPEGRAKIA